jgi:enoyl-CoA hydratase
LKGAPFSGNYFGSFSKDKPIMEDEDAKPSTVVLSIREAGVAVLQLNRPRKRNALSQQLIQELTGVMQQLDRDIGIRSVVLTSVGHSPFSGEYRVWT